MTSLGEDTMWTTLHDPPLGSVLNHCLLGGRHGETPVGGCIMWTITPAPPPGSDLPWRTSGEAVALRNTGIIFSVS